MVVEEGVRELVVWLVEIGRVSAQVLPPAVLDSEAGELGWGSLGSGSGSGSGSGVDIFWSHFILGIVLSGVA